MNPNFDQRMREWCDEFGPKLAHTPRWSAFSFIASELFAKDRAITVVETGCVRVEDNWEGDGQSTRVLSNIVDRAIGIMVSIDNDPDACRVAQKLCPSVHVICEDSISALSQMDWLRKCDLLFLDSYDYQPPYARSELHHAGELAVAWERLPSGCLIAVDDCHGMWMGKHAMVKIFMDRMNIRPILESYIHIWRKP